MKKNPSNIHLCRRNSEISKLVASDPAVDMKFEPIALLVEKLFDKIADQLRAGKRVKIFKFGVFSLRKCRERYGRDNFSKVQGFVLIPEHTRVHFKPSKEILKLAVQATETKTENTAT